MKETIYAVSSGPAPAAIAVIRVSGPAAGDVLAGLTGRALPEPRRAGLSTLRDPRSGRRLDEALCLWFRGPKSATGEDVAEVHVHGGYAFVESVSKAIEGFAGVRLAEPGEFTRRAFEHGVMDLTQAEAVGDIIAAETEAQRAQALRQYGGELSDRVAAWRDPLVRLLAHVEAEIDFGEEEGLPGDLEAQVRGGIAGIVGALEQCLAEGPRGERLRRGYHIALIGMPNVGKSSLLNRLAGRDAAIVSAQPGTTRDAVEVRLDLGGLPVTVSDTAGLRASGDEVEAEGVRRALMVADRADVSVLVRDASGAADGLTARDDVRSDLVVWNKCDLVDSPRLCGSDEGNLVVSALTGEGIEQLVDALLERVSTMAPREGSVVLTRARHRDAVAEALECLRRCDDTLQADLLAEELRAATQALGRVLGKVDVEEVLDVIFREFCIGK